MTRIAALVVAAAALAACIPPPATNAPATGGTWSAAGASASPATPTAAPTAAPTGERRLRFNATPLDARGLAVIAQLEAQVHATLPDGDYWYDPTSGASGPAGGPVAVLLPPNLPLGGPLRADASGGGTGRVTGVFVNGRELHPTDVANLGRFMQVMPGRWWVDAQGNGGQEGGPALFNLYAMAKAAQARSGRSSQSGGTWVGDGMATSTWKSDSGRVTNDCSYDPSDGGMICSKSSNP